MPTPADELPPPLFWAKRIAAIFFILLTAVFVLRFVTVHLAAARLEKFESATRLRGDPWLPADLATPPFPPNQINPAAVYLQAYALKIAKISGPTNLGLVQYAPDERYSHSWRNSAAIAAGRYGLLYQIAHIASAMPGADWVAEQHVNSDDRNPDRLQHIAFELAAESADHALTAHFNSDEATFFDGINDALALAQSLSRVIAIRDQMFTANTMSLALNRLQIATADLRLESPELQSATLQMIERLKSLEDELMQHADRALVAEAVFDRGRIDYLRGDTWLTAATVDQAKADVGRLIDAQRAAFWGNGSDEERRAVENLYLALEGSHSRTALMPSRATAGTLFRAGALPMWQYGENFRRLRTEMRLTRLMLATRLFFARHGRWPRDANELVPNEISEVPKDVHGDGQTPLGFQIIERGRPDGANRAMVYADVGGVMNPPPQSFIAIGWQRGKISPNGAIEPDGRQWRDLEVWPLAAYPHDGPAGVLVR